MKKISNYILVIIFFGYSISYADIEDNIRMEADYILACQYNPLDPLDPNYSARGAINNITGDPTWVVPRENAMAILGLVLAGERVNDETYINMANLTADYLISVQDPVDGAWYNQYSYIDIADHAKFLTQTAEVMIAINKLGYRHDRYNSMKKAAQFLISCQMVENIGGVDHGLVGGGKDIDGNYYSWRWAHDNSYAYWALKAAEFWAVIENEIPFANECASSAQRIIDGINTYLYNPFTGVWHIVINEDGIPQGNPDLPGDSDLPSWINYAPQMLDMPVTGVNSPEVGDWIQTAFQQPDGSCIAYTMEDGELKIRKYPGYSFQAALCWFDTGHNADADSAITWSEDSGLWQTVPDPNIVTGGWIDWIEIDPEPDRTADWWLRFIDTSFYSIACWNGGYDFSFSPWILNLAISYYTEEGEHYNAPASCKMVLDFIREDSILTQDELYEYGISNNHPDNIDLLDFDLRAVRRTLNNYHPAGYNFEIRAMPTLAESMRDICHWMDYEVPGVIIQNVPAVVPTFGNYNNWMVVRGATASTDPSESDSFTVFGFWINDPGVSGIGENSYKTAAECELTYFLPLDTGDPWDGRYAAVSEPPEVPKENNIFISKYSINKYTKAISNLFKLENYLLKKKFPDPKLSKIKNTIKRFNWKNIVDPYLLEDSSFKSSFENKTSRDPIRVKRIDKSNCDYYLVPFDRYNLTYSVLIVDADKGYFKEASWVSRPVKYLPISEQDAIKKVLKKSIKKLNIKAGLQWRPSEKSPSPYYPFWKITIGNRSWLVYQDGSLELQL